MSTSRRTFLFWLFVLVLPVSLSSRPFPSSGCERILETVFESPGGKYRLSVRKGEATISTGEGELKESGRQGRLDFLFRAVLPGPVSREIRGRVRLQRIAGCRFRLRSEREGEAVIEEIVQADEFLAKNGILHFYFDKGRRFFQLDRRGAVSRMVTEYGLLLLQPVR